MSNASNLSKNIGKFLIFLGVLWIFFTYIDVYSLPSYTGPLLLIISGTMIVISTLVRRKIKSMIVSEILSIGNIIIIAAIVSIGIPYLMSFLGPYTARVEKNLQVEIENVKLVKLALETVSGNIVVKDCNEPGLNVKIIVEAGGVSENAAKFLAKKILEEVDLRKEVSGNGVLSVKVSTKPRIWRWLTNYRISIEALVYRDLKTDVNVNTVSGDISLTGLSGRLLSTNTVSGRVIVNSTFESVDISLVSGDLHGSLTLGSLKVNTISGDIYLSLIPKGSGTYMAHTVSGDIKLALTIDKTIGYRIDCSTVSGSIDILNIPDTIVISREKRSVKIETLNYDEKDIKVTIGISTISGNIMVYG